MIQYDAFRSKIHEAKVKTVVFTFGRFQPPTTGHSKLIDKVMSIAHKENAKHMIFPSRSHDLKKNPLSPKEKIKFMRLFFPKTTIVNDPSATNPFKALETLDNKGFKRVIFVVGGDRVSEFKKAIDRSLKFYDFDSVEIVSAGGRDPDSTGVTGMSGSKMRQAVIDRDFTSFKTGVPSSAANAKKLFNALSKIMNVKESHTQDWEDYSKILENELDYNFRKLCI